MVTSSNYDGVEKYDCTFEEIWSPEQLYFASGEDERLNTFVEEAPKPEVRNQNVIKSTILQASLKCRMLETFDEN